MPRRKIRGFRKGADLGAVVYRPPHALTSKFQTKEHAALTEKLGVQEDGINLERIAALEMALIPAVVDMHLKGVRLDRPKLEEFLSAKSNLKEQLGAKLRQSFDLEKLNLPSPKQLICALASAGVSLRNTSKETLSLSVYIR